MQTVPLTAQARTEGRPEGVVPCILYGNDIENTKLQCVYSEIYRAYSKAGNSVLVDLTIDGKQVPVLFHEVQFAPVSDDIIHVDFYAVNLKKPIDAHIPLHFTGESSAVEEEGGVFVTVMDHVWVRCLPTALPQHLDVNIDKLTDFSEAVLVSDIAVPEGVEITDEQDAMIATVQEPRREAESETTEGEEAKPEAETAEKKEGES